MKPSIVVVALLTVTWAPLGGQTDSARANRTSIRGQIVDADNGRPLEGCRVSLHPLPMGLLATPSEAASASLSVDRVAVTDREGIYQFGSIPSGHFRLYVSRLGYRPKSFDVQAHRLPTIRLSIGLVTEPIRLEPVVERAPSLSYYRSASNSTGRRVDAEHQRQDRFLTSDVRSLSHTDVIEAVTLGETDLFRTLKRLPGISSRDEWTLGLFTRGGGYGQTRVYFDGLPLFNPVIASGALAAINSHSIGSAVVFPGYRPASVGEGTAAVLNLTSRRAGKPGSLEGQAELSYFSSQVAVSRRSESGRAGWTLAARRSLPFVTQSGWTDATGSLDLKVDDNRTVELSGFGRLDSYHDSSSTLSRNGAWSNLALRALTTGPFGSLEVSHWIGFSRNRSKILDPASLDPDRLGDLQPTSRQADQNISHISAGMTLTPRPQNTRPQPWTVGLELVGQGLDYEGIAPPPYPLLKQSPRMDNTKRLGWGVLWADARLRIGKIEIQPGLRAEIGQTIRTEGELRLGPRLATRVLLNDRWMLSAGYSRSYQYTQYLGQSTDVPKRKLSTRVWLMSGDSVAGNIVPVLRTDVATAGTELWLSGSWLGSVTAYWRRDRGMVVLDPTPGFWENRPVFVTGNGRSRGVEVSLHRLAGRWTALLSYSRGAARVAAGGFDFPSPGDRKHTFDAIVMMRAGKEWHLGAAFRAGSGLPFTRTVLGPQVTDNCIASGSCPPLPMEVGRPNAHRVPSYQSLDLMIDRRRQFSSWQLGGFLKVRNVLAHRYYAAYRGSYLTSWVGDGSYQDSFTDESQRQPFLKSGTYPALLFGLRASF